VAGSPRDGPRASRYNHATMKYAVPRSSRTDVVWPGVPEGEAALVMALQYQFDRSQFWPVTRLRAMQFAQLHQLASHAFRTMPFWRARLSGAGFDPAAPLTEEIWSRLPVLSRREVQSEGARLFCLSVPPDHGGISELTTSGSSGMPVRTRTTRLLQRFWDALVLRDAIWHDLDLTAKYAIIRNDTAPDASPPHGRLVPDWGRAFAGFPTAPAALLDLKRANTADQVAWLQREQPAYLMSYPSNLDLLARHCLAEGIRLPGLRAVRPFGEVVTDEVREVMVTAWGAPVIDAYSAVETGMMALQCPHAAANGQVLFHVLSEGLLLEVLSEDGRPCVPGEVGRVVVTQLHNFVQPLLRYEIGDYVEVGAPCACGRGLPVLNRIIGKTIDRFVLPNGERHFRTGVNRLTRSASIIQVQVVQTSRTAMEIRVVLRAPLTTAEEADLRAALIAMLGHPFDVTVVEVAEIPRHPSGKFRSFISDVT